MDYGIIQRAMPKSIIRDAIIRIPQLMQRTRRARFGQHEKKKA